ncbi:hypothetical protein KDW_42580 [Dictyobacter vulcani]|uniref:Uncharacterized protein n=1 Tax=Dictyobacter vulcani TaxID=2607529 RepID=A0A5J4KY78_9CHLR|nr:hypothetical protein [Dictyobacter vulcani]GER90096.1 hypothetical protein KDW_42580 [Dictyobacter vulcani]
MKLFHTCQNEKASDEVYEGKNEDYQANLEADIMHIHRHRGNVDIRQLHPEMTEQEAVDYLSNLINNHMRRD